jgi:hypothetical protein
MICKVIVTAGRVLVILLAAGLVTLGILWWVGQISKDQFPGDREAFSGNSAVGNLDRVFLLGGSASDGGGRGLRGRGSGEGGGDGIAQNLNIIAGITLAVAFIKWIWGLIRKRKPFSPNQI